jgi:hypothetical protein
LNDSGTWFLEHWFFLGFSLDLGYPVLLAGGFSGFLFLVFPGCLDLVFCLDIGVLVNRSI